jgi:uncharacterized protein YigA (DUF484 family)
MEDTRAQIHAFQGDEAADPTGLTDDMVAGYLIRNPSFLTDNPDLFEALTPPDRSSGDGVVDLQRVMVEKLRAEVDDLRECAQSLIDTSRDNLAHQSRTHSAVIALLGAKDLADAARIVADDVAPMLELDAARLCFEDAHGLAAMPPLRILTQGTVDKMLGENREARLISDTRDDGTVFGDEAHKVRSCALVRLHARDADGNALPPGILALGAGTPETFQPGQGTDLIGFLARVIERCMSKWPGRG